MFRRKRLRYAMRSASQSRINLRALPRGVTWCGTSTAMTRAKRVIMRNLAAHPIAFVERYTQGFAETPISLVPVCLGQPKLSLKSGLAEVNIVHLQGGHGGGLGDPKDEAPRGKKNKMISAQAEFKKSSDTGSWGTSCLSPGYLSPGYCHRVICHRVIGMTRVERLLFGRVATWMEGVRNCADRRSLHFAALR
jgi:hypothetical protein